MTERQKIAHLLRRFGLGASRSEMEIYEPLGVDGAVERLLDYEKQEEGFPVSPWEFCFEPDSKEVYLDPLRPLGWWSLRLLMTRRPLQEKLTIFWHDHFAVSAQKVEFGPMMLEYLNTLRRHAIGPFPALLKAVARDPAMIRFLDTDQNFRGEPNENFGRELLELFTVGIGHFTEKDVKEAARCFTGWGNRYLIFEAGGEQAQAKAREAIERDRPMVAYAFSPELHDSGPKTILGRAANFSGEELCQFLAERPETARHITSKLWEFFAYENPEQPVRDRLERAYFSSGMDIRAVLREIARSPEFWSDRCVRRKIKSPMDFAIPVARQFDLQPLLAAMHPKTATRTTPLNKPLRDSAGLVFGTMYKQGMMLLYPPDVGGWEWGSAWITSNNMIERIGMADLLMGVGQKEQPLAGLLAAKVYNQFKPATSEEIVEAVLAIFDAELPPGKRALIVHACEKHGGVASLVNPEKASRMFSPMLRLLFGAPEYQFC